MSTLLSNGHKLQNKLINEQLIDSSVNKKPKKEEENNSFVENRFETRIDSLDDYFLVNLFSLLNVKEKIAIERVCKRWLTIIRELLLKQNGLGTTFPLEDDWLCLDSSRDHCVNGGDIREAFVMSNGWFYDLTHQKSIDNLEFISKKCPNVKCLHINHCIIDSKSLKKLLNFFPSVDCIHLKNNVLKSIDLLHPSCVEWNSIGEVLGPHIRHLSLDPHYEHRMNEYDLKQLIQHFNKIEEFRVGTHFDREVVGKFVNHLSKTCKLFYSNGREFSMDCFNSLKINQKESLTHLSYFSNALSTADVIRKIGETFNNLVRLKINLSFNEIILTSSSPISKLPNLQEFSIDLNTFSDIHVDDGLIWCIKDGLPSLKVLEISRACLSPRAFNSIEWCLPQLNKLVLNAIETQCCCESAEIRDRSERYCCPICRKKCWQSIANLKNLQKLFICSRREFYRQEKPKLFHNEFCELLPQFKSLRFLSIFRYDLSLTTLFESLDELMKNTDSKDLFILKLKSIPSESLKRFTSPKVYVIYDSFML